MAKIVAPLMSFDGAGQIGKTLVYASWRGRNYARRWVSPAQPRTTAQMETRNTFSFLQATYKRAPTLFTAPWLAGSKGRPLTDRNLFTKSNNGPLIGETTLDNLIFSPGAFGGLPPASMVITPGSGTLSIAITPPSAPVGWTIASAVAAVIRDQDPQTGLLYTVTAGQDTTAPYTVLLSGLTGGSIYQVGAWLTWTKPDGSTAYSPDIRDQDTPS